jgi:hypothetical protein
MSSTKPNFMHKKSCTCPTPTVAKPCYVWFHYPNSPGRIHRFLNVNDAYKFAHDTTIEHLSLPTLVDADGKLGLKYKPEHLYDNNAIYCDVDWHTYLCDIISDLNNSAHTNDHIWNISAGNDIQVAMGLGTKLPLSVSKMFCSTDAIYVNNQ